MSQMKQKFELPFVGQLYDIQNGLFLKSCTTKDLPVLRVDIHENQVHLELGLCGLIDQHVLNSSGASHVVLRVYMEVDNADSITPVTASADLLGRGGSGDLVKFPFPPVCDQYKVIEYGLSPIQLVAALNSCDPPRPFQKSVVSGVDVIVKLSNLQDGLQKMMATTHSGQSLKLLWDRVTKLDQETRGKIYCRLSAMNSFIWAEHIWWFLHDRSVCLKELSQLEHGLAKTGEEESDKKPLIDSFQEKGVLYVTDAQSVERWMRQREREVYILFFSKEFCEKHETKFVETFEYFDGLLETNKQSIGQACVFVAADLDLIPSSELRMPLVYFATIRHFKNGRCVSKNLVRDMKSTSGLNLAKGSAHEEGQPKHRAQLLMPCPMNFLGGSCSETAEKWTCEVCRNFLDYGFDSKLYCNCGAARLDSFMFRCCDYKHGPNYVKFHDMCATRFDKLVPMSDLNILILGQSGVGKSTWINGIINYILYESLDMAKQNQVQSPIPIKFTVTDDNYQTREIISGVDDNEDTTVGASATQDCRTYTLRYRNYLVKLMDTPGLSDSRGIVQDRKNVKKILDHIRNVDQLHGICILLKPNESRLGILLRFCVKEILAHLHKNCSQNIVYCFTNSRSTFYRPGDTLPVLEKLLDEIDVRSTLNKNTIYCLDNEAYRYLCTCNVRDLTYTAEDEKSYQLSWDKSVAETKRLLDHVTTLKPHETHETLSLNQAKSVILSLTKPIADITHNIEVNIAAVDDHRTLLQNWNKSEKELMDQLYTPQVSLEQLPLSHPRTVCVNSSCVEYYTLSESQMRMANYVTHCHPHCYLTGIAPETYPNEGLLGCAAMAGHTRCQGCKCSWQKHMHIYFEQKRTEIKVKDRSVESELTMKGDSRIAKEKTIQALQARLTQLEEEKAKIISTTVKFGQFLKKNAITPYNDAFNDYLMYLIDEEESKPDKTQMDLQLLTRLRDTHRVYAEEARVLEDAMQGSSSVGNISPADIKTLENELYSLPVHGQQLKRAMQLTVEGERSEGRYSQKNITPITSARSFVGSGYQNPPPLMPYPLPGGGRGRLYHGIINGVMNVFGFGQQNRGEGDYGNRNNGGRVEQYQKGKGGDNWRKVDGKKNWRDGNKNSGGDGGNHSNKGRGKGRGRGKN